MTSESFIFIVAPTTGTPPFLVDSEEQARSYAASEEAYAIVISRKDLDRDMVILAGIDNSFPIEKGV